MQDILMYAIIFGLGIALVSLFFYRKDQQRILVLSEQLFTSLGLAVSILKEKGKVKNVIISFSPITMDGFCASLGVELIDAQRKIKQLDISHLIDKPLPYHTWQINVNIKTLIDFATLQKYIEDQEFSLQSFRFVTETKTGKKFKSHELAFNEYWHLFKIDSGQYN